MTHPAQTADRISKKLRAASPKSININDVVWVRLTNVGKQMARYHHPELKLPPENKNGWSEWHLWALFRAFGEHIGKGMPVPFGTEILLEKPIEETPIT